MKLSLLLFFALHCFTKSSGASVIQQQGKTATFINSSIKDSLARQNHDLQEALKLCDSLRVYGSNANGQKTQAQYLKQFQQEKNLLLDKNNRNLQKKLKTEQQLMVMYIVASLGLLALILLYLRGIWLSHRLQKEKLKTLEAEAVLAQQQRDYEQKIASNQKNTVEEKEREVTSMALRLANYYDSLNGILEKFETFATLKEVKYNLQQLVKQKDYWKQFETRFNTLNPNFADTLLTSYPKLTKNDVEFCSLVKIKLSNKEIASLLQISHESVITKKYRIRKKMEVGDDADFEKILMLL